MTIASLTEYGIPTVRREATEREYVRVISRHDEERLRQVDFLHHSPHRLLQRQRFVQSSIGIVVVMRVIDSTT